MTVGPAARSRTDDDSAWMGWIDDSVIVTECDHLRYLAPTCGMGPTSIVISINRAMKRNIEPLITARGAKNSIYKNLCRI